MLILSLILLFSVAQAHADTNQDKRVDEAVDLHKSGEYAKAKEILAPLAEVGHAKAINIIGMMHDQGQGYPANADIACSLYERSANLGYTSAMYNLSHCYDEGLGKPQNPGLALEWITKAANHGLIRAMLHLATKAQTETDERFWLKKASDSGSKIAAAALWEMGYHEDAPDFSFLDSLCIRIRILTLHQGMDACDD